MSMLKFAMPDKAAITVYLQQNGYSLWNPFEIHTAADNLAAWIVYDVTDGK